MRLDFLYTRHTANCKTFVIAATAAVVNIIIEFFQTVNNCSMTTKSNKTSISIGNTKQDKNLLFHVTINFSNDTSKKHIRYIKDMEWNDPWSYRYTLHDLCPLHSSHLSLRPVLNECIWRVQRRASCLMFHQVISLLLSITKTHQQPNSFLNKPPHTHTHTHISVSCSLI